MTSPDTLADRLEKARLELADQFEQLAYEARSWSEYGLKRLGILAHDNRREILAALRSTASAREVETIERCAKIAERAYDLMFPKPSNRIVAQNAGITAARAIRALAPPPSPTTLAEPEAVLCSDCPPLVYPTDETRCSSCPRQRPEAGGA